MITHVRSSIYSQLYAQLSCLHGPMVFLFQKDLFEDDYKKTQVDLMQAMGLSLAVEQKQFYDYLHLSPIKVILPFMPQP